MGAAPSIVWLRHDLRLADHPALMAAAARGGPVIPVFIWAPEEEGAWPPGAASRWWLHQSLAVLGAALEGRGSRLILRRGPSLEALRALIRETGAEAVYWNRRYEPAAIGRDTEIKRALRHDGRTAESFNGALLVDPPGFVNKQGGPFKVFTPFWKSAVERVPVAELSGEPDGLPAPPSWPRSEPLRSLSLEPELDWAGGLRAAWRPGEAGAADALARFLEEAAESYAEGRDRPSAVGTSRLSPHLHFGEISPRTVWHAVRHATELGAGRALRGGEAFLRELYWREFAHYLLFHFPHTAERPLREEFERFPWRDDPAQLRAWQRGRTGIPLVDAGMRELWATGWMHNRVRMIAASFLMKNLLLPWQAGARWFWDTLVDADLASNTLGWQWTAGCGADAAPYFRVFNPVLQGEKFDPEGAYVRRWVPEIAALPNKLVHRPWESTETGGGAYPPPLVDLSATRARALSAFQSLRGV